MPKTNQPPDISALPPEVASALRDLYSGPPKQFIVDRRALAKRLNEQDPSLAKWVGSLPKPGLTAWTVNRFRSLHLEEFEGLVESGRTLRQALSKGNPAEAMAKRREAVDHCLKVVETDLKSEDRELTIAQRRKVAGTLEALSVGSFDSANAELGLNGLLAKDLSPPGMETLAGLALSAPTKSGGAQSGSKGKSQKSPAAGQSASGKNAKGTTTSKQKKSAIALAKRRVSAAKKRLGALEGRAEKARAEVLRQQTRLEKARKARADLRAEIEGSRANLAGAEADLKAAIRDSD